MPGKLTASDVELSVNYAPTSRGKCRSMTCRSTIGAGSLRLQCGPVRNSKYVSSFCFEGPSSTIPCFWSACADTSKKNPFKNLTPGSVEQIHGFDELEEQDQLTVSAAVLGKFTLENVSAGLEITLEDGGVIGDEKKIIIRGNGSFGIKEKLKLCGCNWYPSYLDKEKSNQYWCALDDEARTKLLVACGIDHEQVVSFPITVQCSSFSLNNIEQWEDYEYAFVEESSSSSSSSSSSTAISPVSIVESVVADVFVPSLTEVEMRAFLVAELKFELKKKGLVTSGKKSILLERLMAAVNAEEDSDDEEEDSDDEDDDSEEESSEEESEEEGGEEIEKFTGGKRKREGKFDTASVKKMKVKELRVELERRHVELKSRVSKGDLVQMLMDEIGEA